ncbi:hypothetical protein C8R47DRAFT_1099612 [Mycena vitilis]|nr:hypothetical protein C8R47DRAFT_1099612 [Mycena vitilis]
MVPPALAAFMLERDKERDKNKHELGLSPPVRTPTSASASSRSSSSSSAASGETGWTSPPVSPLSFDGSLSPVSPALFSAPISPPSPADVLLKRRPGKITKRRPSASTGPLYSPLGAPTSAPNATAAPPPRSASSPVFLSPLGFIPRVPFPARSCPFFHSSLSYTSHLHPIPHKQSIVGNNHACKIRCSRPSQDLVLYLLSSLRRFGLCASSVLSARCSPMTNQASLGTKELGRVELGRVARCVKKEDPTNVAGALEM